MMVIEDFKKDINNSLKEIQENTGKQLKTLKELQENIIKQVKEMNKTIQDLKKEIETIKRSQRETTLELENLGETIRSHRCKHHQQNTRDKRMQKIP
jgi:archaellum component FlaC